MGNIVTQDNRNGTSRCARFDDVVKASVVRHQLRVATVWLLRAA